MKKRIVRLTEKDLQRIVKRVIKEDMGGMEDSHPTYGDKNFNKMSREDILNLDRMGSSEYSEDTFEDEDEFEDFDSYRKSKYGKDPKNKWEFNDPDKEMGRKFFNTHQEKSEGKPFKVRRR